MCSYEKSRDAGVSPVVGVMLMLVVTIIIAAVVSAYSGGLTSGQKDAPKMSAEVQIRNSGTWTQTSGFLMTITATSEPIPTKDLKIITTWVASDGTRGGANATAVIPGQQTNSHQGSPSGGTPMAYQVPVGYGPGITGQQSTSSITVDGVSTTYPSQAFGNYSWVGGTSMKNTASSAYGNSNYGSAQWEYADAVGGWDPDTDVDGPQAILGKTWNHLRPGDIVNFKVYHIPSAKIIYNKDIIVV